MVRDRRPRSAGEQERREDERLFHGAAGGALSNVARMPVPPRGQVAESSILAPMVPVPLVPPDPGNFRISANRARRNPDAAWVMAAYSAGVDVTQVEVDANGITTSTQYGAGMVGIVNATGTAALWCGSHGLNPPVTFALFSTPDDTNLGIGTERASNLVVNLRMTYDPATGQYQFWYEGVLQFARTLQEYQRLLLNEPTWAGMRGHSGHPDMSFDDFRVNGVLVDTFNRPDFPNLGPGWSDWPFPA